MAETIDEPEFRAGGENGDDPAERPHVVALGASAGGLEALKEFLGALPSDTGACYVFVQHLDPTHKSMLPELLGRCTEMSVVQAEENMALTPDSVILIPPDATLTILDGVLHLRRPAPPRQHRTPIDTFFASLAEEEGERAIGIIFSGTGSDGTEGLRRIKEAGGLTVVQSPESAKYDSMPRNAAAATLIDHVLAPGEMPAALIDHMRHAEKVRSGGGFETLREQMLDDLSKICSALKARTGHDFTDYKEGTLLRRIQRRMQVLKLDTAADYLERLRSDPREAQQLFRELLISVTSFFREPQAFEVLAEKVIDPLIARESDNGQIRIWVPACASGEEAYSIAMILRDRLDAAGKRRKVQIFATDIDETALERARRGCYAESIVAQIPEHYRNRFLKPESAEYRVAEELREMCIFSTQSVLKDPPFGRLDLISCRNLLIYLRPQLQNRLIPLFHYALRKDGVLFLGSSENVTQHAKLFETLDGKWRIYRRRETADAGPVHFPLSQLQPAFRGERERTDLQRERAASVATLAERAVLDRAGPAYAVIGEDREVLHTGGNIDRYLTVPRGPVTRDILSMTLDELRMDVRAVIHRAQAGQEPAVREGLTFRPRAGDPPRRLRIEAHALDTESGARQVVTFHDCGPVTRSDGVGGGGADHAGTEALEDELRTTKQYLQTTTEELESSNEELKSANEELMSMNEELQSSNEELETSKEELQSVNEELETVNAELASKVDELSRSNADLQNLFESTRIATVFLDRSLRVRRFTPVAKDIFHLIEGDVGRPITDIASRVAEIGLEEKARNVLDSLTPIQEEVEDRSGKRCFIMRLLPYTTAENVVDGVVATFVDITELKQVQIEVSRLNAELKNQVADLETLVNVAPIGIAFADDEDCSRIFVNKYGAALMKLPEVAPPAGRDAPYRFMIADDEVAPDELPLQKAWRTGRPVRDFRAMFRHDDGTSFEYLMSAAPVRDDEGHVRRVIGVFDDVSNLVATQRSAERRAAQQDFVATLSGRSLRGETLEEILEVAPQQIAQVIGADFCKVLRYRPDRGDFVVAAQHGFRASVGEIVPGGHSSQAGYTLSARQPVIVEDLGNESRFSGPRLLLDHHVRSGISVTIPGALGAWGVLGIHALRERLFSSDEVAFVQSVANTISSAIMHDEAERDQKVLLAELRHRVKNTLATVQAIVTLSFSENSDPEEAAEALGMRIGALAQAHTLLFESNWREIEFDQLLEDQLRPFSSASERIDAKGPNGILVDSARATELAMILHELLTNASKYGALSNAKGRIEVRWKLSGDKNPSLEVLWRELGGPPVKPPERKGLGRKLIEGAFAKFSGASTEIDFAKDGVRATISLPLV